MPIRIVHVYPQLNCGGTEMVFYNLIKFADRNTVQFDILVQRPGEQDQKFRDLGCEIHVIPYTNKCEYRLAVRTFLSKMQYVAVHAHMHEHMHVVLQAAREAGVKHCVAHSHNARIDIPRVLWPLRLIKHRRYEKYATDLFGCSQLALKWLFPLRWRTGRVIYNAIDLEAFRFNADRRVQKRQEFNISDTTTLVVNVGRCTDQKNQRYIVDTACRLKDRDIKFIIIGDGPLLPDLKKQIEESGVQDTVLLLGQRDDVKDWLCAADVFMFPSIYEGLGIVAIEAQASGLRVVVTDNLPAEADMGQGNFERLSLDAPAMWDDFVLRDNLTVADREALSERAFESNYNIRKVARDVQTYYLR